MNRNNKKANEILFDIIKLNFDLLSISDPNFNSDRWVFGNNNDADWLTRSVIKEEYYLSNERRFCLIEYNHTIYFASIGFDDPDSLPSGLSTFVINPGIFTVIVSELELPIKSGISNLYIEQNILSQSKSVQPYTGHSVIDLVKIFPNVYISEITSQYIGDPGNLSQIICSYLANNSKYVNLPLSIGTLGIVNNLVLLNSKILNYESIIQALLSSHYKFLFLDLYRCIEMLYQIIYIDAVYQKLSLRINKTDFLQAIDKELNWRPVERNALKKIFIETPNIHLVELQQAIKLITNQTNSNLSEWVYDLRNSIVHLKSVQTNYKIDLNNWDKLIYGLVNICCYWYTKYQNFV